MTAPTGDLRAPETRPDWALAATIAEHWEANRYSGEVDLHALVADLTPTVQNLIGYAVAAALGLAR